MNTTTIFPILRRRYGLLVIMLAAAYTPQIHAASEVSVWKSPYQTEVMIATALAAQGEVGEQRWLFVRRTPRNDLEANGQTLLDAEGEILNYSALSSSGYVTYAVRNNDGLTTVKVVRPGGSVEGLAVARIDCTGQSTGCLAETATGKKITGDRIVYLSKGLMAARPNAVFIYEPGRGVKTLPLPQKTEMMREQPGDILASRHLLVRDFSVDEGGFLGIGGKQGFALIDIDTGKKSTQFRTGIPAKNGWLERDEERDTDVRRRMAWFVTKSGVIVASLDNGLKDLVFVNLGTGQRVIGYTRDMGIAGFEATQEETGQVRVRNYNTLGIATFDIQDVEKFMREPKPLSAAPAVEGVAQ